MNLYYINRGVIKINIQFTPILLLANFLEFVNSLLPKGDVTATYNRICDFYDCEPYFDADFIERMIDCLRKLDYKIDIADFEFKAVLRKKTEDYTAYIADLTIYKKDFVGRNQSRIDRTEIWPVNFLFHEFDTGIEGMIHIRRKATFFSYYSESSLELVKAPLDNPVRDFEKKIFVSQMESPPLNELIGIDVQEFLLGEYKNYPFTLMDNPYDGIYINKLGIFYLVRRSLKESEITKYLLFGEKLTSMIHGILNL